MHADGPFAVKCFLLLAIGALGFLWARDLFFIIRGPSDQKNSSYAAADSPATIGTRAQNSAPRVSPTAQPEGPREQSRDKTAEKSTSLRQDAVKNLPADQSSAGDSLEPGNRPIKKSGSNAKSLRSDEGARPTGDFRTGVDAKPLESLRSPAESGITGSLRSDEGILPTGSLRPNEGSLPTGSLR